MKRNPKTLIRTTPPAVAPTTEQWHAADLAITALNTALEPLLQLLTEDERENLLPVGIIAEAFTRDYITLIETQPDLVPAFLRPADTQVNWKKRDELANLALAVAQIAEKIADTVKALEGDCYAAALAAYRILVRGGTPAGYESALAPMRGHIERREAQRRATRAKNRALKEAEAALAAANGDSPAPPATAAAVIPLEAGAGAKQRIGFAPAERAA